ncbi:MAG: MFS transporter [Hyphomicrobiaceae bacterium]|nr:MFS transporter [Hyphomicrobiaceae bacterium]
MPPPLASDRSRGPGSASPRLTSPGGLPALLGVVTGVQALATFSVLALPQVAPTVTASLGVGAEWIGYQVSLVYLTAAIASASAGAFVRRLGPCRASVIALLMSALGMIGIASGHLLMIAVASLLVGVTYSLTNPAASHLLIRFGPPSYRNVIFALKQTGVPLGALLGALLMPTLSQKFGWQTAFAGGALMLVLLALVAWPMRAHWDDDRQPSAPLRGQLLGGVKTVYRSRILWGLSVLGFVYSGIQVTLMSFTVTLLVKDLGWDLISAGYVAAAMNASGAIGRICWGFLADRTGKGSLVLIAIGIGSTFVALAVSRLTSSWPTAGVTGLLMLYGFLIVGWNGVFMGEIARASTPSEVGAATGGGLVFCFIGVVIGPTLYALLYKSIGSYALTFGVLSAVTLIGSFKLWLASRPATPADVKTG